jgi:hypothetical protein
VIIGSEHTYVGDAHSWAKGLLVRVVAVHRGDDVLAEDARIGAIEPDDTIEFQPWIQEDQRFSAFTSDARPWELRPC